MGGGRYVEGAVRPGTPSRGMNVPGLGVASVPRNNLRYLDQNISGTLRPDTPLPRDWGITTLILERGCLLFTSCLRRYSTVD